MEPKFVDETPSSQWLTDKVDNWYSKIKPLIPATNIINGFVGLAKLLLMQPMKSGFCPENDKVECKGEGQKCQIKSGMTCAGKPWYRNRLGLGFGLAYVGVNTFISLWCIDAQSELDRVSRAGLLLFTNLSVPLLLFLLSVSRFWSYC